ncbi:hypothetical protein GF380_03020 [Candidatus Uhrbacteria bacterium]|nr:hypothetical protein [Candidatus Uhrbacteria bacterium]MBD3284119.1 hypothetical protein [Candidatus Uhrbacteria bacterium]
MSHFKPIYVVFQEGVPNVYVQAAMRGMTSVVNLLGVRSGIPVHNFGVWREPGWRQMGSLVSEMSVDWYIQQGRGQRRNQIVIEPILQAFAQEVWQQHQPHYDVLVLHEDLHPGGGVKGVNFILGCTFRGLASVVSCHQFARMEVDESVRAACMETTVMHEIGHLFGLCPKTWVDAMDQEAFGGPHCTNRCIMRQRVAVDGWLELTRDRLEHPPFCQRCYVGVQQLLLEGEVS